MKIIGIGDLLIPKQYIEEGFDMFLSCDYTLETLDWPLKDYEELQNINLKIEQGGREEYIFDEAFLNQIKEAEILITQFCPINKQLIDACKALKAVGVLRGGYENVNVDYANEKGILVFNTPGRNANAVADFTVGMILSECRNIAKSHMELKKGNWVRDYANKDSVPDLAGKTVGIIGYGNIGQKVAQRLKGFEVNLLAYDPYMQSSDEIQMVSLEELMSQSDFVTIHSRLTKDNQKMIDLRLLTLMKPTAYLINTARSGLVDEEALYQVLKEEKIAGAAIDVFEVEPPGKEYPLITLDNITVTPHLAGGTKDAFTKSPYLLAKEMKKVLVDKQDSHFLLNQAHCLNNPLIKR